MQNDELRKAQEELEESRSRYSDLYDFAPIGYFVFDSNGLILEVNLAGAALLGVERSYLVKKPFSQYVSRNNSDLFYLHRKKSLETKTKQTCEIGLVRKDGSQLYALLDTVAIENSKDNPILLRTTITDITERKQAEEKLKNAHDKLKEYNQLKDEFVSTASHELRTPLSIIMGAIRLVLDEIPGQIVEEQRDVLATAMESVQRLSRIVNSLLTISKIESGKLNLQKTVVNICELIKDTVSNYESLAQENGIHIDCEIPSKSVDICLDPDKTKEVLINLISNSLKFTPEGGWVKIICTEQDKEVLISVQDSGVGIAKEYIPKLFDKFTQFDRKAGSGEKGTGLGLAIVKKLVEIHGGKIKVESEVGQGTIFTISLPLTTETLAEDLPAEADELVENTLANN